MSNDGRVQLEPAYLLHRKPYRETSLLLEAFSLQHGRVGLIARGARSARSSQRGLLQPYQPLLLSWSGRGDLRTLTGAEPGGRPRFPMGTALASGFYLNELMLRLIQRHDPHPELYVAYDQTIARLGDALQVEWALRLFERDLLQALGYGLPLTECVDTGEPVQADARYCYHLEGGPVAGERPGALNVGGATLLALAAGVEPDATGRGEAKRLMRSALGLYLGDKPLASRALYRQMQSTQPKGDESD